MPTLEPVIELEGLEQLLWLELELGKLGEVMERRELEELGKLEEAGGFGGVLACTTCGEVGGSYHSIAYHLSHHSIS